jgi:L-seryl-tRNA(Ser) seleniumtransferase
MPEAVDSALRQLPAMHRLLAQPEFAPFAQQLGPVAVKRAVAGVLDEVRRTAHSASTLPSHAALVERIAARLAREGADGLLAVINATGILLHTNLGRAPLPQAALAAVADVAAGYSNIEYDLSSGVRGSRYDRVTQLLRDLTGAQAGIVVNNCAAAVLLVLDTFAKDREVVVARNELIEIGGGFRLPDVLARSGARLVEVGTTNKVYVHDFERALSVDTALLMRSHRSNFRLSGFVAEVAARELAELGRRAGVVTLEDLGTGALVDLAAYGLPHERTVSEAIADGMDLVAFSADKLLGGPQAGVIVGNAAAIARLRANPLLRALRVDKATLAALAATLRLYAMPDGRAQIPLFAMLNASADALAARADALRAALGNAGRCATTIRTVGYVGGGTLPEAEIASAGVAIAPPGGDADAFASRLRGGRPPIVARVHAGLVVLDLRTVPAACDETLTAALRRELAAER